MMLDGNTFTQALKDGLWKAFIQDTNEPERQVGPEALNIGTNSVDLTLGSRLLFQQHEDYVIEPVDDPESLKWIESLPVDYGRGVKRFLLMPGDFCLGFARERFEAHAPLWIQGSKSDYPAHRPGCFETYFVPMFEGRSTLGRLGLAMHITAGFGDYGFAANFTMEINNVSPNAMLLTPGMRVAQLHFESVTPGISKSFYSGAYVGKNGGPHPPVLGRHRFFKEQ